MFVLLLAALLAVGPPAGELILFEMDSDGSAYLLHGSDFTVVVDTGQGEQWRLVDDLREEGVTEIDLLILSHPHDDHVSQAADLVSSIPVGEVWVANTTVETAWEQETVDAFLTTTPVTRVTTGVETQIGSLHLEVVWPDSTATSYGSHEQVNHDSLVVVASVGDTRILLPGDTVYDAESRYAARVGHVDVLVLAHHGHSDATSGLLLDATSPDLAVYSRRVSNAWTLSKLADRQIPAYGTHDGTVKVDLETLAVSQNQLRFVEEVAPPPNPTFDWGPLGIVLLLVSTGGMIGWILHGLRHPRRDFTVGERAVAGSEPAVFGGHHRGTRVEPGEDDGSSGVGGEPGGDGVSTDGVTVSSCQRVRR